MGLYNSQTQASSMETKLIFAMASMAIVSMAAAFPYPYPQAPGPAGLAYPKAGPNGHYDAKHYFQYTNVAAPDVFEWGYRRGNDPQHFREEYLSQKAHNFKAKLRWGDAYEGQGEQFYDYNHGQAYAAPHKAPEYSPPIKTILLNLILGQGHTLYIICQRSIIGQLVAINFQIQ